MLYYSIAHYYDVSSHRSINKYRNIERHIGKFLEIDIQDKCFILVSAIDSPRGDNRYDEVKKELENFCKKLVKNNKIYVIVKFNWGGTISALWESYILLKEINTEGASYVAHFEEDFGPNSNMNSWYNDAIKLLFQDDNIYIGESNIGRIKSNNDDDRLMGDFHKGLPRLGNPEVWSDGGFYFSTIEKLKIVEERIGIFHKGNPNNKYNNAWDGISLGEVGFPTLLFHAGFKFSVLNRSSYFINEWND